MGPSLPSLIQKSKAFLTPRSSSATVPQVKDGFTKAPTTTSLFPKVDPSVDGDDCDHDCESCHIKYPKGWKIDEDDKLYGHVNGWDTHLLVGTGKTDWVRDVQDEKGSVMQAVRECGVKPAHNLMLSASNLPLPPDHDDHPPASAPTTVLLLPAFTFIDNVTPTTVPDLIRQHIDSAPTNTTPLNPPQSSRPVSESGLENDTPSEPSESALETSSSPPTTTDAISSTASKLATAASTVSTSIATTTASLTNLTLSPKILTARPCNHRAIILLCSQRTRDARCGQSAPLLLREFGRHLRPLGLYRDLHDERPGGVGIYFISHVGGHKFAANVMIYRRGSAEADKNTGEAIENGTSKADDVETNGHGQNGPETNGTQTPTSKETDFGEATQCIWLARVRPEDCEGIVKHTVLKGKVVKPDRQLRGGFDRARQLVSW